MNKVTKYDIIVTSKSKKISLKALKNFLAQQMTASLVAIANSRHFQLGLLYNNSFPNQKLILAHQQERNLLSNKLSKILKTNI